MYRGDGLEEGCIPGRKSPQREGDSRGCVFCITLKNSFMQEGSQESYSGLHPFLIGSNKTKLFNIVDCLNKKRTYMIKEAVILLVFPTFNEMEP